MTISIFNGSPRGQNSNSTVIIKWIIENMSSDYYPLLLKNYQDLDKYITEMMQSEKILIVFPLYTDAMPGIVMKFFEEIYANKDHLQHKKYLFVVHSGFPEAKQSYPVREYLKSFMSKVDGELIDVVINGGSEATRLQPEKAQKKKRQAYNNIGVCFEKDLEIGEQDKRILATPIKLSKFAVFVNTLLMKTGVMNIYWDILLRKNKVKDISFDKPYLH